MAIELAQDYLKYVDELFTTESRLSLLTNKNFTFNGTSAIKIYKVSTASMVDYVRDGALPAGQWSRYGLVEGLDATTETFQLNKDRSFTFAIDRLDAEETKRNLEAAGALARQLREVVIPEIDKHVYSVLCSDAGQKPSREPITSGNIYDLVIQANNLLDVAEVPEAGRVIVITPDIHLLMKKSPDIIMETNIGNELRIRGVIGTLDGLTVLRVPANRLPNDFGFLIAHPVACCAPVKLDSYKIHENPPGISGSLVEGRINYDAFVLDNKANAIVYQEGN